MRREQFEVLPNQANMVECQCIFCAGYGGVGSGKTYGAQWKMFKRMRRYPKSNPYVCGADFEQLRNGYFLDFQMLLEESLNWRAGRDYHYRNSPRPEIIFLDSGVRLRALSSELAQRMRSLQIQSLHAEEPQTWRNGEEVWQTLVGRMRHSIRSRRYHEDMPIQAWLTFNPGGSPGAPIGSWLHKLLEGSWRRASDAVVCEACRARVPDQVGYPSWRFSLRDNYLSAGVEQYVQNLLDTLPEEQHKSEIDGHWKDTGGSVYYTFSRALNCKPVAELPAIAWDIRPDKPIFWTLDFNVEWMASLMGQMHVQPMVTKGIKPTDRFSTVLEKIVGPAVDGWQRRIPYFLDEICINNAGAPEVAAEFIRKYRELTEPLGLYGKVAVWIYGDRNGGSRAGVVSSSALERTPWQVIGAALTRAGIPFVWRVPNSNPQIVDGVAALNMQFREGSALGGRRGAMVDEQKCVEFIADMEQNQWSKTQPNTVDKSDKSDSGRKRTHWGDAARYFVYIDRAEANGETIDFPNWMER